MGTRFIATPEARTANGYKETLLSMAEDDTVVSRAYTGKTCRVVRTEWTQHFEEHPEELKSFPEQFIISSRAGVNHLGPSDGVVADPKREFMPAGQGAGAITSLMPAGELVLKIVNEARQALSNASRYVR
jgi:enoyl-[acyl-carrier protein] reductase II